MSQDEKKKQTFQGSSSRATKNPFEGNKVYACDIAALSAGSDLVRLW